MATVTIGAASFQSSGTLRLQLEELLVDFYSVVGVVPRRPHAASAADILADDFQGRFFSHANSELLVFNKAQLLGSNTSRTDEQHPSCELLSLKAISEEDGLVSVSYTAAFRCGHTVAVRRGSLKALRQNEAWLLCAVEEDVRVFVVPEATKPRGPADRPRIWII